MLPGLVLVVATSCGDEGQEAQSQAAPTQGPDIPVRTSFTLPEQMRGPAALLEEAGVEIVYGPNSVPPPDVISDAAKAAWLNLPQVPTSPDPDRLPALRSMALLVEDAAFEQLRAPFSMEDRVISGVTTLWSTPPQLEHEGCPWKTNR